LTNRRAQQTEYKILKRKISYQIALIAIIAFIVVVILRSMASNRMGNFIVAAMRDILGMSYNTAKMNYDVYFRANMNYLILAAVVIVFIILSRVLLSRFADYFLEINEGLDTLVGDREGEIKLSPEMASMERKLNTVQQTLETREREAKSAEQRKNDMVMYLAHDIKTPLTSVIGYLSLLDEAPDMPAEQKIKYVRITMEKAYRLERLIDEFF